MKLFLPLLFLIFNNCSDPANSSGKTEIKEENKMVMEAEKPVIVGAARFDEYIKGLQGKRVALLVNHTAEVNGTHLVDTLLAQGINIVKIFGPEHGFRGTAPDGEKISSTIDQKTGIPIISLYGNNRKPTPEDMKGVDVVIFDIQDVGARFYTFISSMSYMMEAAAENNVKMIVLDRPNPNGHYVDGPVMQKEFTSFIGLHQVPLVHGMTVGEYAKMVNEEGWLKNGVKADLQAIPVKNYTHKTRYNLPLKPSPNLPNMRAIYLYPSLGPFEATQMSVGRGTDKQFQILAAPDFPDGDYYVTPVDKEGAKDPKYEGKKIRGYDFTNLSEEELAKLGKVDLQYLINVYQKYPEKDKFFLSHFHKLAGTKELEQQIKNGMSEEDIRKTWQNGLEEFKKIRKKYLIYEDFE